MAFVLGIDVSTTATKAVLIDAAGSVRAIGVAGYELSAPRPLWSEQAPELWWEGAQAAIRSALATAAVRADEVVAVGLTGQMHGAVLLDGAGRVLRPAILWNDQRTAAECDLIRAAVG
ncbi:MAG: FGGY family carbohydrate kinase, partial [Candidatus Limnocylindrales bacterium]